MGWNSWNHLGAKVTDKDIRDAADALVASGMRDAGYIYVNIDDGWQGTRDAVGNITPNDRFPDMHALADYIHSKGLKFGIYSSPGPKSCSGLEGGMGHEEVDAKTFASWDVDYLKYDVCSYRKVLEQQALDNPDHAREMMIDVYGKMSRALASTGRPIFYSISQHGFSAIWQWGPQIGANLWRIGDDIHDNYLSVTEIGFAQAGLSQFAAPGHWNDPDMLEIGNGGLAPDEARTQMSLWSLLAAPLLAGNDLSKTSLADLAIMTNREVIAIDQDRAGHQGDRIWSQGPIEIWARDLADGGKAVGIFNRNASSLSIPFSPTQVGWSTAESVRDVWQGRNLPPMHNSQQFLVPRHGVVLLVLHRSNTVANGNSHNIVPVLRNVQ